jgi:hypothetical protein
MPRPPAVISRSSNNATGASTHSQDAFSVMVEARNMPVASRRTHSTRTREMDRDDGSELLGFISFVRSRHLIAVIREF